MTVAVSSRIKKHRNDIQVLRGIAVLAVVLFHLAPQSFSHGYLGVDLFFVISGFVVYPLILDIVSVTSFTQKISRLKLFYSHRFYRLAPALSVTLAISWILVFILGLTTEHARFLKQAISSIFLIGNLGAYRFSWGNYFERFPNPLIHLWSLSAEEQIYLITPLVFLFLSIFVTISNRKVSISILSIIITAAIWSQIFFFPGFFESLGVRDTAGLIFYSPFSHIWEFAIGALTWVISSKSSNVDQTVKVKSVGLIGLLALVVNLYKPFSSNLPEISVAILTAIVIATRGAILIPGRLKNILSWFGDRSYSVYLVHMPLIYIFYYSPYFANVSKIYLMIPIVIAILFTSTILFSRIESRYRYPKNILQVDFKKFFYSLVRFGLAPLIFFAFLLYTPTIQNFSLVSQQMPKYADSTDPNCNRLSSGQPCMYSINDKNKVSLLIGDSVATAYADEFVRQSNARGLTAVTMTLAGCAFILPNLSEDKYLPSLASQFEVRLGDNLKSCFQHNKDIVDYILNNKPANVFLSQHTVDRPDFIPEVSLIDQRNIRLRNIEFLNQITRQLVVVGAPPLFMEDVVIARGTLLKVFGERNTIDRSRLEPQYEIDENFFKSSLTESQINYRSLTKFFCTETECRTFRNNKWLYFDASQHLSIDGAKLLKGVFA